jgi:hypothetical protein
VVAVYVDQNNNIWYGSTSGLTIRKGADWFNYTEEEGLISNTINHITADMEGNIWIATPAGIETFQEIPGQAVLKSPGLVSPGNGSSDLVPEEVILTWNPVTGATAYTLEIDTLGDFADTWITEPALGGISYTPAALADEQQYYWRVAGIRGTETGPWSEVWNFTTKKVIDGIPPVEAAANYVTLYPNPARDQLYLTGKTGDTQIRISIYSLNGQLIGSPFNFNSNGKDFRLVIDISDKSKYPTGVYVMQIAGDTFNKKIKITVL